MIIDDLLKQEKKFGKFEYQLKIKGSLTNAQLVTAGAKKLGTVMHEDMFFSSGFQTSDDLIRVRKEGDENLIFAYKGPKTKRKVYSRFVIHKTIDENKLSKIRKENKKLVTVHKNRTIYVLDDVIINLDKVESLGEYVEFAVTKKSSLYKIEALIKQLGFDPTKASKYSYFELALINLSPFQRFFSSVHEKFGNLIFGISSAVLTTLGVIVGLNSATANIGAVIGGLIAVAVADSSSDAMGMYSAKRAERGVSNSAAAKSAFGVFFGKAIFTLTFIIPFLFFDLFGAIIACLIWGAILLSFVNAQIAFIEEQPVFSSILKNLALAAIIVAVSWLAGLGISMLGL